MSLPIFSKDGNFVWNEKKDEIKDAWLDDIDWVKVIFLTVSLISTVPVPIYGTYLVSVLNVDLIFH